jgi:hypothetical protein
MSRPFIPVANCASVELIYSLNPVTYENVLHVKKASPYTLADLQAVRAIVVSWDSATGKTIRTAGSTMVRVRTKALDTLGSPFEDYSVPSPVTGTHSGSVNLPQNVAYAIRLATGLTGRSYRGRVYVGGLNGDQASGTTVGVINTAARDAILTAYNTLMTSLASGGHTLCVVSYRTGKAWRAAGVATTVQTITAADLNLDSQRRRLPGRGI